MDLQKSISRGKFIVIDGPNGAGKSTLITQLRSELHRLEIPYLCTKEPTESKLGVFIRNNQNEFTSETLACLVAANRYEHMDLIIRPAINDGLLVLCDRYFPSSLVYQRMDGLELTFIQAINSRILIPDLTVFLSARENILRNRLRERDQITRFEKDQLAEIQLYQEAESYLASKGWKTLACDSAKETSEMIAEQIATEIKNIF
jgi:dTMP kinase